MSRVSGRRNGQRQGIRNSESLKSLLHVVVTGLNIATLLMTEIRVEGEEGAEEAEEGSPQRSELCVCSLRSIA